MEKIEEFPEIEEEEVYDEAKVFLGKVKEAIEDAKRQGKKVVYVSEDILILSLEEQNHIIYEVYNTNNNTFTSKLVYIGEPKLAVSYLLNLIHKQELLNDPHYERNY